LHPLPRPTANQMQTIEALIPRRRSLPIPIP
jgi:hypothetical protein